jgi:hypothetical protein
LPQSPVYGTCGTLAAQRGSTNAAPIIDHNIFIQDFRIPTLRVHERSDLA